MSKKVSFLDSEPGKKFSFRFCDSDGNIYYLDENTQPVKGMNPFVYDQLPFLENVNISHKKLDERNYITEVRYSPKDQ